jgi:hypothetical protein
MCFLVFDLFRSLDLFGEKVSFKVRGKDQHTTLLGAFITAVIYSLTLAYAYVNLQVLQDKTGSTFTEQRNLMDPSEMLEKITVPDFQLSITLFSDKII